MPNALLVYPSLPENTYWGMGHALPFIGKKANIPPLGLATIAAMFPDHYNVRIVDENVQDLTDDDIRQADMVFTSSMVLQADSLDDVIERSHALDKPVVVGGPHPTQYFTEIPNADHFVLGEAESGILQRFLSDLEQDMAKKAYSLNALRIDQEERAIDVQLIQELEQFFGEDLYLVNAIRNC